MKKVTIYSTPTCHFCHDAKDFLTANGVEYTEYNVAEDTDKRSEMIDLTGQMGVPVIVVGEGDDRELMIGFNEPKLRELVGIDGAEAKVIDMTSARTPDDSSSKMKEVA